MRKKCKRNESITAIRRSIGVEAFRVRGNPELLMARESFSKRDVQDEKRDFGGSGGVSSSRRFVCPRKGRGGGGEGEKNKS